METLSILAYGGIGLLGFLLMVFEIRDIRTGGNKIPGNTAYEFYTSNGTRVRISKTFGSGYKVYVYGNCQIKTKKDRYGRSFFTVRARSASEAEYVIDDLMR